MEEPDDFDIPDYESDEMFEQALLIAAIKERQRIMTTKTKPDGYIDCVWQQELKSTKTF